MADTYEHSGPRCPYCQHLHRADDPAFFDESRARMECERCDREFEVHVYTSVSWSCNAISGETETNHG